MGRMENGNYYFGFRIQMGLGFRAWGVVIRVLG